MQALPPHPFMHALVQEEQSVVELPPQPPVQVDEQLPVQLPEQPPEQEAPQPPLQPPEQPPVQVVLQVPVQDPSQEPSQSPPQEPMQVVEQSPVHPPEQELVQPEPQLTVAVSVHVASQDEHPDGLGSGLQAEKMGPAPSIAIAGSTTVLILPKNSRLERSSFGSCLFAIL